MLTTFLLAVSLYVIEGDTFAMDGQSIRIANIDAPETMKAKCDAEFRLGMIAKAG
ncbi:hypothetical protein [Mesorhizobium sp. CN2-181]|uniref:hypothetical protein n=1 Tax=Mesorhizobium yinganensis TaxID=3157707 RepID=UPI0032B8221E